jgi:hypothetical protein
MSSEQKAVVSDEAKKQNDVHPGSCMAKDKCPWTFISKFSAFTFCMGCGYVGFRQNGVNHQICHMSRFKYIGLSRNKKNIVIGFAPTGNEYKKDVLMTSTPTSQLKSMADAFKIATGSKVPVRGPSNAELDFCDECMLSIGLDIE